MPLAIFDLDHTLLDGDTEVLWVDYLAERGVMSDGDIAEAERFFADYEAGRLDIAELQRFMLRPMADVDPDELQRLRDDYFGAKIEPLVRDWMLARIDWHRDRGDTVLVMSATSDLITEPVVAALGVDTLLATQGEKRDGRYTGEIAGTPCFRDGKVIRLDEWMVPHGHNLAGSWFYSDSHNDLPLLEAVENAVAVTPDTDLARIAASRGWIIMVGPDATA